MSDQPPPYSAIYPTQKDILSKYNSSSCTCCSVLVGKCMSNYHECNCAAKNNKRCYNSTHYCNCVFNNAKKCLVSTHYCNCAIYNAKNVSLRHTYVIVLVNYPEVVYMKNIILVYVGRLQVIYADLVKLLLSVNVLHQLMNVLRDLVFRDALIYVKYIKKIVQMLSVSVLLVSFLILNHCYLNYYNIYILY